jgi:acyl-ACP thioesterase
MPISTNFTSILTQEWTVNFLQCYPDGYLKHTELCNLLQLTAALHAEQGGISFTDMQVHHQAWVLSRMRVEIAELPKWRDVVTIKTWINSLENSRSTRCLEVYLGDRKIVGCETFWAVFNTNSRRPEPLQLPFDHFVIYPDPATVVPVGKIELQPEMNEVGQHTVVLSDLDIVNHANSVKYLEWCLDTISLETLAQKRICSLDMNYMKEVSFQDPVSIHRCGTAASLTFALKREDKSCFALHVQLA